MRKIPSGDFEKFLRLVDEELAEPFTIIVVGGAAIGIVQPPYEYEDRLRPLPIRGLKRLQILVPEAAVHRSPGKPQAELPRAGGQAVRRGGGGEGGRGDSLRVREDGCIRMGQVSREQVKSARRARRAPQW